MYIPPLIALRNPSINKFQTQAAYFVQQASVFRLPAEHIQRIINLKVLQFLYISPVRGGGCEHRRADGRVVTASEAAKAVFLSIIIAYNNKSIPTLLLQKV